MFFDYDICDYIAYKDSATDSAVIDFVNTNKYSYVTKEDIDDFLYSIGVEYNELTSFARNKINELDI